jgi:hypothetical protein
MAGFVATTGTNAVTNFNNNPAPGAQVGDGFYIGGDSGIGSGTFATYTPDGPSDPVLGPDLSSYQYLLSGVVSSVAGNVVDYAGTYRIYYDINGNGQYDSTDTSVSLGNSLFTATFGAGNTASIVGSLTQTQGPTGPFASNFADLGARYGYHPVDLTGNYTGNASNGGATGTLSATLTQTATVVPLPKAAYAGLGLIAGLGLLGGLKRRQRRLA